MIPTLRISRLIIIAPALALVLALAGCSSSKKASSHKSSQGGRPSTSQSLSLSGLSGAQRTLVDEARKWLGTPYKYGGNTRGGVDCSGLVYHVYQNSLDIKLPRNSARQHDYCSKVKKDDLLAGDLVFFATNKGSRKVSHVGLYVGDGKMIHASTSKGVIVQNLSDAYYVKAYVGAGRVDQFAALSSKEAKKAKESTRKSEKKEKEKRSKKEKNPSRPSGGGPVYTPSQLPPSASRPSAPSGPSVPESRMAPAPMPAAEPEAVVADPVVADPVVVEPAVAAPDPVVTKPEPVISEPAPIPVKAVRIAADPAPDSEPGGSETPEQMRARVLSGLPDAL